MCEALNEINKKILGKLPDCKPCHQCSLQCDEAKLYHMSCGERIPIPGDLPPRDPASQDPRIMFVFESPGNFNNGKPPYRDPDEDENIDKLIPGQWDSYWSCQIPKKDKSSVLDIKQQWYGQAIAAAAHSFGWRTIYATNLVKCGIADGQRRYLSLTGKPLKELLPPSNNQIVQRLVDQCFESWLYQEIELFKPTVIFAMTLFVEEQLRIREGKLKKLSDNNLSPTLVHYLPHPANHDQQCHRVNQWLGAAAALGFGKPSDVDEFLWESAKYWHGKGARRCGTKAIAP